MRLLEKPLDVPLRDILGQPPGREVRLYWLGQAGFVVEGERCRAVIDPYLSDSLAQKYRGARFLHERMMPAPVQPGEIAHVDMVLATHAHTDHLDPGTLPTLMAANPDAILVAPRAARTLALERAGILPGRLATIEAGETLHHAGIGVQAVRASHEALERDEYGYHRFLGLALTIGESCIFHSGDTIPFAGQEAEVAALRADLALLPVNGRDAERTANGVPGNLTMAEALALARAGGIGAMIAHHFDLFNFNTAPREGVEAAARASETPHALAATAGRVYGLVQ